MKYNILAIIIVVIIYEHIARTNGLSFQIAPHLNDFAVWIADIFYQLGTWISHISSFINYFHLDQLMATVMSLVEPIFGIAISPLWTIEGYIETALTYVHPSWVWLGTALIIIGFDYVTAKLRVKPLVTVTMIKAFIRNVMFPSRSQPKRVRGDMH